MTALCLLDDLPAGVARGFDPWARGADEVVAVRDPQREGAVHVYRNDCPHEHRPLGWRKDAFLSGDGQHLMCFAHGARFEIASGLCVAGPCIGASLQALPAVAHDGTVWLVPSSEAERPRDG